MIEIYDPKRSADPGVVLVTEGDVEPVLRNMLSQATKTVDVVAFSFVTAGEGGQLYFRSLTFALMQKLKELSAAKVRVRVYLEGARETAGKNRVTAEHLRKAGVEVRLGATHAKGFCVDGRYTFVGSTNLTDQSLTKNFETNVLLDGFAPAKQFTRYFEHYFEGGGHGGVTLKAPFLADGDFKPALLKAIAGAKKSIAFSIYFFKQAEIEAALVKARGRGVNITGLVHTHRSFGLDDVRRTRATVERLRDAGLDGLTYSSGKNFTHSKYLIADGRILLLGSGNWLDRDVTTHPQLYVRLEHPALCRALGRHLAEQLRAL